MRKASGWGLLLIMLAYMLLQLPLWSYLTDDTYIHLVYAKNVLQGQGWVFNPGEPSYGSTSPLWILLLAPAAGSETSGLAWAHLLGVLCGLVSIPVFWRLAGRILRREGLRIAATLLFATEVWFLRWSASGMESSLAVLVALLFFDRVAAGPRRGRDFFIVGLMAGLAAVVRPEFYLLIVILLVQALFFRDWRRHWLALLAGTMILPLPWLIFAKLHIGLFLPSTGSAKAEHMLGLADLAAHAWKLMRIIVSSQAFLLLLAGLALLEALARTLRRKVKAPVWNFMGILATLWGILLLASQMRGGVAVVSRYLMPVTPLLTLAAFFFLDKRALRGRSYPVAVTLLVLATLAPNAWLYTNKVLPHTRQFTADWESTVGGMADYLAEKAPPGTTLAVQDIGLLGYRSGCRILDLVGLIQPEVAEYWHELGDKGSDRMILGLDFLRFGEAQYLIDRDQEADRLVGCTVRGRRLEKVMEGRVGGLGIARSDDFFYTLYRIHPVESAEEPEGDRP